MRGASCAARRDVALDGAGALVIDETIPDAELRAQIFAHWSNADITTVVDACRQMRVRDDGSALNLLAAWYGQTRKYSPTLLAVTPFDFTRHQALGEAVNYLNKVNRDDGTKFGNDAPTNFLARRWQKYVISRNADGASVVSRPFYELAVLTTLNDRLKAGDVSVTDSRRWTDFDDYLIPTEEWQRTRQQHYAALGLPVDADAFIHRLGEHLASITTQVDAHVPANKSLTIDAAKGEFSLAALVGHDSSETVKRLKHLIETGLPHTELTDILIDLDNETDFLRHFISHGTYTPNSVTALHRRNVLAALIAVGCNIGPQRMVLAAPGLNLRDISAIADWCFSEEALKAAVIELVNYAVGLPLTKLYGSGHTCSADGMRFYVPVNVLAADYSPLLHARGVTMLTHTSDNYLQFYQQAVPCKLREATFNLDGLVEHDTELDPKTCYTDTHGYTEVVMATAALLGFELAPRIKDIKDQTLYNMDCRQSYSHLDPLLTGHIRPHLIRQSWDEVVRVIASIRSRVVSPSLILHRLGSYARQNSHYQALAEIGRVYKTIWILRYLDSE